MGSPPEPKPTPSKPSRSSSSQASRCSAYTGLRSTVSLRHALLGALKDQPLTGYDLVRHFQGTVGFLWSAPQSQIYLCDDIEARRASSEQPVLASG